MSKDRSVAPEPNLTELPSLPPGWCWTTLAVISSIDGGITKDQKRERTASMREVPYLRVANVQRGYLDLEEMKTILADSEEIEALRLSKGDILFTEGGDRDKLGRGWVWNDEIEDCIHQNHIFRARPHLPLVDPKFVSFHGNFFGQKWFTRTGKQTTNLASINKGVLSRFPVPLAPINEQRRIVARIEELFSDLDAGVAALERARANLKRYRAAVLKVAVEGRLTAPWRERHPATEPASKLLDRILTERRKRWEAEQEARFADSGKTPPKNWREKYTEPTPPDTTGLSDLPPKWCWVTLEQLNLAERPMSYGVLQPGPDVPDGVPLVRVCNVADGEVAVSQLKRIAPSISAQYQRTVLQGGELLLTLVGTIGRTAVAPEAVRGANTARAVGVVPLSPLVDPRYVEIVLREPGMRSRLTRAAHEVARKTLNLEDVRSVIIPLAPAHEQAAMTAEVEERLSVVTVAESQIEADVQRTARLRQSILKRAFEGKLVPQDPTDEPASALLGRIRAERQAAAGNGQAPAKARRSRKEPR